MRQLRYSVTHERRTGLASWKSPLRDVRWAMVAVVEAAAAAAAAAAVAAVTVTVAVAVAVPTPVCV